MSIQKLLLVPANYKSEIILDVFRKRFEKVNASTDLTPEAKNLMLQILVELQEQNSSDCDWAELAKSTGTNIATVKKRMKELREWGFVIFIRRWRQSGLLRLGRELI